MGHGGSRTGRDMGMSGRKGYGDAGALNPGQE